MHARNLGTTLTIVAAFCLFAADAQSQDMLSSPNYVDAWHQSYIMTYPLRNQHESESREASLRRAVIDSAKSVFVNTNAAPARAAPVRADPNRAALRAAVGRALGSPAPAAGAGDVTALGFRRDPAISAKIQQQVLSAGAAANSELAPVFASGKVLQDFDRLLTQFGHSPQNLADVTAAFLVVAWEVVNDRDSGESPVGRLAVRRQFTSAFMANPTILAMNDAQKQAMAEQLAYSTMLAGAAYQQFKRSGDAAQLATLQDGVRRNVLASGVDLRRTELTDNGLLAR